ncbi:uncharacterized protein BT62DRAFT_1076953 [Guyanagaster necrorhizus]|uniref:Uncharacterized protein n=1 Tax=Guyanagaster necrorhizus TaxID=856835 RepID=A0A9P8ARC6_9AGAR|nr:uncharacterized protein BT62DRAFT_1076953 [Guyanagaster necrorhizus MCA 3950]KAG7445263.1 hypothetical protein BT62DRAFT_1076953 [Guyanagaster necrorhizus MCA 3950]
MQSKHYNGQHVCLYPARSLQCCEMSVPDSGVNRPNIKEAIDETQSPSCGTLSYCGLGIRPQSLVTRGVWPRLRFSYTRILQHHSWGLGVAPIPTSLVDLFPEYPIKAPCLTAKVVAISENNASRACGAKMVIYRTSPFRTIQGKVMQIPQYSSVIVATYSTTATVDYNPGYASVQDAIFRTIAVHLFQRVICGYGGLWPDDILADSINQPTGNLVSWLWIPANSKRLAVLPPV